MVDDESQGHAEKNLGAFVEETIPDPQDRLRMTEIRPGFSFSIEKSSSSAHLDRKDVDIEADEPARHHQSPNTGILVHELSHRRRLGLHQFAQDLLVRLQAHHVWVVVVCKDPKVGDVFSKFAFCGSTNSSFFFPSS